jgi:hypothetical protein
VVVEEEAEECQRLRVFLKANTGLDLVTPGELALKMKVDEKEVEEKK